ncbi:MAG: sugar ABC transporter permease, partial [Oscillospiraceae bacterium]|nr:sugar ABC transporter permease [Oscillospiraceae bacterium]
MRLKYTTRRELVFAALVLPSLIGVLVFFVVPFIVSARMTMIDNPVGNNFVGLFHFEATLENTAFKLAMRNTFDFISMSVPLNMVFALLVAMMLRRVGGIGKAVLGTFFVLPLVVPSGAVVHFWRSLFGINGFINGLLFGTPNDWLNTDYTLFLVVIIFLWKNVGFSIILYMTGLYL